MIVRFPFDYFEQLFRLPRLLVDDEHVPKNQKIWLHRRSSSSFNCFRRSSFVMHVAAYADDADEDKDCVLPRLLQLNGSRVAIEAATRIVWLNDMKIMAKDSTSTTVRRVPNTSLRTIVVTWKVIIVVWQTMPCTSTWDRTVLIRVVRFIWACSPMIPALRSWTKAKHCSTAALWDMNFRIPIHLSSPTDASHAVAPRTMAMLNLRIFAKMFTWYQESAKPKWALNTPINRLAPTLKASKSFVPTASFERRPSRRARLLLFATASSWQSQFSSPVTYAICGRSLDTRRWISWLHLEALWFERMGVEWKRHSFLSMLIAHFTLQSFEVLLSHVFNNSTILDFKSKPRRNARNTA